MEELRGAARARTYLSGAALEDVAVTGEPCLIQNLSLRGASLVFREGFAIPRRFDLFIGQDGQAHRAVTIWRNGSVAGVKFLQPRPNAPEVLSV
jgi:hypothetical protein